MFARVSCDALDLAKSAFFDEVFCVTPHLLSGAMNVGDFFWRFAVKFLT